MKKFAVMAFVAVIALVLCSRQASAQYHFFDGKDWMDIHSYGLSANDELAVKEVLLKSVFEVSLFNNMPLLPTETREADFQGYVNIIDKFYAVSGNDNLPLYFALRIAGMEKRGTPPADIARFEQAIFATLKQQGILK